MKVSSRMQSGSIGIAGLFVTLVLCTPIYVAVLGSSSNAAATEQPPLRFGARGDVPPMAYVTEDGQFRGYMIDICEALKRTYRVLNPDREIADGYVKVTAADRRSKLEDGEVDTICGAFSVTEERMHSFDFSFLTFASGASVAARRSGSTVLQAKEGSADNKPPQVAVVSQTTTEALVEQLLGTGVDVLRKATHDEAFDSLVLGEAEYYFGDRVILSAIVGRSDNANEFVVGGNFLTYEPYALPFAKGRNRDLMDAANITIAELYRSRKIHKIYENHFEGQRPSDLLLALYQLYALPE